MPLKSGERFKSGKKKFLKSSQKDMMGPLTGAVTRKMGFLSGSAVKNLPATQETQVQSLGQEETLEKGMATPFSILAWRIPWTEEPFGLQSIGSQRVRHDSSDFTHN